MDDVISNTSKTSKTSIMSLASYDSQYDISLAPNGEYFTAVKEHMVEYYLREPLCHALDRCKVPDEFMVTLLNHNGGTMSKSLSLHEQGVTEAGDFDIMLGQSGGALAVDLTPEPESEPLPQPELAEFSDLNLTQKARMFAVCELLTAAKGDWNEPLTLSENHDPSVFPQPNATQFAHYFMENPQASVEGTYRMNLHDMVKYLISKADDMYQITSQDDFPQLDVLRALDLVGNKRGDLRAHCFSEVIVREDMYHHMDDHLIDVSEVYETPETVVVVKLTEYITNDYYTGAPVRPQFFDQMDGSDVPNGTSLGAPLPAFAPMFSRFDQHAVHKGSEVLVNMCNTSGESIKMSSVSSA